MTAPLVLVSGFGPFEVFEENPSGAVALALAADPPRGARVQAIALPVSFARAPTEWDEHFTRLSEPPAVLLGLGVMRDAGFRLERRAGPELKLVPRLDVDGRAAGEFSHAGPRLETAFELPRLLTALAQRGVREARLSDDAGGYVCERIYHHLLLRGAERGLPALFVHVPPVRFTPLARQLEIVRILVEELVAAGS